MTNDDDLLAELIVRPLKPGQVCFEQACFRPLLRNAVVDDATRIRWGSIHEFKGLEAPAVILTDVDLSKEYHRDLLYVGASRATDRPVVVEVIGVA